MKNRGVPISIFREVILMVSILSFLTGCFGIRAKKPDPPQTPGTQVETETAAAKPDKGVMPGELCGVRLELSGGSMSFHSEFGIEVTPDEIVWAEYWPEDDFSSADITRKEHVPVTAEQWGDLVRIVGDLYEELEPVLEKPAEPVPPPPEGEYILDGGDYHLMFLTWRTEDGDRTVQYYNTSDRREMTFISLLKELAEPISREIVWYDPPVPSGIFYHSKADDESLQCTPFDDGTYYFIARYYESAGGKKKGERRDVTKIVDAAIWEDFSAFLEPLVPTLKECPPGRSFDDPLTVTVYQSDGRQFTVQPDKETAKKIRSFFTEKAPGIG